MPTPNSGLWPGGRVITIGASQVTNAFPGGADAMNHSSPWMASASIGTRLTIICTKVVVVRTAFVATGVEHRQKFVGPDTTSGAKALRLWVRCRQWLDRGLDTASDQESRTCSAS